MCTPDCDGKECGDDGCGSTCGSCEGQCLGGTCSDVACEGDPCFCAAELCPVDEQVFPADLLCQFLEPFPECTEAIHQDMVLNGCTPPCSEVFPISGIHMICGDPICADALAQLEMLGGGIGELCAGCEL